MSELSSAIECSNRSALYWRMMFSARIRQGPNGCIGWTGDRHQRGYGKLTIGRRPYRATHIALELFADKPKPARKVALHSCDRPQCVNIWHLRWGTEAENAKDKRDRDRIGVPIADRLSPEQLDAAMRCPAEGSFAMARELGITPDALKRLREKGKAMGLEESKPVVAVEFDERHLSCSDSRGISSPPFNRKGRHQ